MARHAIGLLVVADVRMAVGARAVGSFVADVKLRMTEAGVLPIARVLVAGITRARIVISRFATGVTR